MRRRPRSWRTGALAARPAATWAPGQAAGKQWRPPVTDIGEFSGQVTVDLGNDGVAFPAVFSAGGAAVASVGPAGLGMSWSLDQAFLGTSVGPLDAAVATLFVGPLALPETQVAANLQGGGAQYGLGGVGLPVGWYVIAQWTGGTPGATAQLRVTGLKTALMS